SVNDSTKLQIEFEILWALGGKPHRLERAAGMDRHAEFGDRCEMRAGAVTDIAVPGIAPGTPRQRVHDTVARDLGDDRGGSDRKAQAIATHHRLYRAG